MKKKYIVISRFRFSVFISFMFFIMCTIIYFILPSQTAYGDVSPNNVDIIYICKNDTLWEIARKHNTKNHDIRKVVDDIEKLNNISNADIYPGDRIKVPIY